MLRKVTGPPRELRARDLLGQAQPCLCSSPLQRDDHMQALVMLHLCSLMWRAAQSCGNG